MYKANIEVTEKDMTWGQLKTLCEGNKLRITSLSLMDNQGVVILDSAIDIPSNAEYAIHFKSAEMQIPSGSATVVAESVGYIEESPGTKEVINRWYHESGKVVSNESQTPRNAVHGIRVSR